MDIMVIQYLLCIAGIVYSIAEDSIIHILMFGCILVFNTVLMLRAKNYVKKANYKEDKRNIITKLWDK